MQQVVLDIIISFFLTFYVIPVIIYIAKSKKLYDIPDKRKAHKEPVPLLGGLGIFIGFILGILLTHTFSNAFDQQLQFFIAAFFIIFFLGISDDFIVLSPLKKFVGQLVVAFILIFKCGVFITDLHGFMGIHALNGFFSYLFTYVTIIVIINSFNLIDGVDGLAGSLALISSVVFGTWFYINGDMPFTVIAFALAGSVGAFLIYNFQPAKIFMGDAGSMLLGLVNVILVIHFINTAPSATVLPVSSSPAVDLLILSIPLLDTLRVFCMRIIKGRSPFSADRNHIHHLFVDRGFSHRNTTLTIAVCSILFALFSFSIDSLGCNWVMLGQSALFFISIYIVFISQPGLALRVIYSKNNNLLADEHKNTRVVSIVSKNKKATTAINEK